MEDNSNDKNNGAPAATRRKKLLETTQELKKALDAWDDLEEKCQGPSADEVQLDDVKKILREIKNQIDKLS